MKQLTIEEEAQIGEIIAERLGLIPVHQFGIKKEVLYKIGARHVTANGVFHALKEVVQELREKEVL